ncbi:MAG: Stealth CR1 domain-containing protein [Lachnospiraceae bacterium]|nr:Stealth CR1 domain-containing protein [Lachnospiraceae bacterium]
MKTDQQQIDFVLIWVDGNDPEWRKTKQYYLKKENTNKCQREDVQGDVRYRDWDNLKYWFRAVEKYAPWVHKVHFVTCGQTPEWMNNECAKLNLVNHKEFIPEKYLPTFSSHPIELNLHRIEGLSEQFVYFNDDFFLTSPVVPEDFFVNGLPCDFREEIPLEFYEKDVYNQICVNNIIFLNRHFSRRASRKKEPGKWYSLKSPQTSIKNLITGCLRCHHFFGMETHHVPQAYLKNSFQKVWELEPEWMDETCSHRFRDERDLNQHAVKFWQLMSGNFEPYNMKKFGKVFTVGGQTDGICSAIVKQRYKTICINDSKQIDFITEQRKINNAFEKILSEKSSFEK